MVEDLIPLSTPWLSGKEKEYLMECVDTGWVAGGPFIQRFEEAVTCYLSAASAVAVSSGTAALEVSLKLIGVEPEDEVACPSLTFVATSNAISNTGAHPAFIDSQPETWGMDPASLRKFLETECVHDCSKGLLDLATGRLVKAIVVVHLYGHPVDMEPILAIAQEYKLPVIEDATESFGSQYKGQLTGMLGHIGCLSFNGNKTITSGGGGMIVSHDADLLQRARYLINQARDDGPEFYHSEIGHNYRMSNLHAAVGLAQFERLNEFIEARRFNATIYEDLFSEVQGIEFFSEQSWARSNYWLSTISLDSQVFPVSTKEVMDNLRNCGIEVRRPFVPNHLLPPYQQDRIVGEMHVATSLYESGLNLPSSAWMKPDQVKHVADSIISLLRHK